MTFPNRSSAGHLGDIRASYRRKRGIDEGEPNDDHQHEGTDTRADHLGLRQLLRPNGRRAQALRRLRDLALLTGEALLTGGPVTPAGHRAGGAPRSRTTAARYRRSP